MIDDREISGYLHQPDDEPPRLHDQPLWIRLVVKFIAFVMLVALVVLLAGAIMSATGYAATPRAGGGRAPACKTITACHRALAWQQRDRQHLRHQLAVKYSRDAGYAIHLAAAAFGVNEQNMRTIARCESNLGAQVTAEAGSGASGLFQFLPSTWRRTPFSGFDIFDPLPNALAAAQLVVKDGSWREWSCSSITGVR